MVRKTKLQSKRLVWLKSVVLDVLHFPLYIPCLPSCGPKIASVGLLCLLAFGWARPIGGTSIGLEDGRKVRSGFYSLVSS